MLCQGFRFPNCHASHHPFDMLPSPVPDDCFRGAGPCGGPSSISRYKSRRNCACRYSVAVRHDGVCGMHEQCPQVFCCRALIILPRIVPQSTLASPRSPARRRFLSEPSHREHGA